MKSLFIAALLTSLTIHFASAQDGPLDTAYIPRAPEGRAQFAQNLKRALLGNGINISAASFERKAPDTTDPVGIGYPKLWLFGYFNDSVVFQLATKLQLLQRAKKLEFKSVEFQSKDYTNGGYWYNIAGPSLPSCDVVRRLCL